MVNYLFHINYTITVRILLHFKLNKHYIKPIVFLEDPCTNPEKSPSEAPELRCEIENLWESTKSDNGYVIIGILQPRVPEGAQRFNKLSTTLCEELANDTYKSGMGMII